MGRFGVTTASALITGGGRRIGAFIAKHLASNGYHVFLHVNNSREEGRKLVEQIAGEGGSAQLLVAELGNEIEVDSMMRLALSHDARLSVIINNASHFEYDFPFHADVNILRKSIASHILGPFFIFENLRAVPPEQSLTIVNMLDQKLENTNPDYYSYTIGKASLYGITKIWQSANLPNIRTFGILLGLTLASGEQSAENYDASRANNPMGRSPDLGEITSLIDFFICQKALPGQTVALDGGESLVPRPRDVAFDRRLHRTI
jgi:NAD(P)-dependent dehydrogenase (short-subunit alcohol dehydrogenase family)